MNYRYLHIGYFADTHWFNQLGIKDIDNVGGQDTSLGEMISHLFGPGIKVPDCLGVVGGVQLIDVN